MTRIKPECIDFNGYARNEGFKPDKEEITLETDLKAAVEINNNSAEVLMSVSVGTLEDNNSPFMVGAELRGYFDYNLGEDESEHGFDSFLRINGVAILYPYVRSLISNITNLSNEYPGYNLPTINVHRVLEEQDGEI